ncbi:NADPH:quinone reductase [Actinoplanes sp. SE50]|uniref:NADP-dependent oxidoreductase n=1 Tax=unclassified Actinoplanes TaxID=2626549 RepID=UPI00023ECADF|nr:MULTISPECIES: NADP-dependent oxidoreductase [unclassified Actinoplanes]AEV83186.1 alcohol dehydrogenase [Actinoplanes sp. SE50/110]ATO81581.1 NADPH:quinone reductase [Actinoplanes sp. SE50]SLL98989.1 NADPH:quinone reductase [Actinoplanes sp. SE50/110]
MRAIVFQEFGGPEVLRVTEADVPEPGPGQVRIRVRAAGVNQLDHKIREGAMAQVFPTTFPATPGLEAAGVIDATGEGVTGPAPGDEVIAFTDTGAYAEFALATVVAPKPAGLSWAEAAALPVAGETAQRVLGLLGVKAGETLLIHGASGAVGGVAVQLAVASGATVIGVASPANHDYVRSLGAIPVAYGEGLIARVREVAPQGVDAVFDAAGYGALPDSIDLAGGSTERVVTIADPAARTLGVVFSAGAQNTVEGLTDLARLAGTGALRLTVAGTYPLSDAGRAQVQSATGHTRGKLVIAVPD